jgi:type VI secretion system protein ImpL
MQRIWTYLMDVRTLSLIGFLALAGFFFLGADTLRIASVWAAAALAGALAVWLGIWGVRRWRARSRSADFADTILQEADKAEKAEKTGTKRGEVQALRSRLTDAIRTIKTSKIGLTSGAAALYELPWYIVIGNPAAGKSSAIVRSGMQFPFADKNGSNIIQGIGGTRNCDWFFTSEGILLDTAGRYSVHEEDRAEWMGFLSLLKKHRAKAPINGIIIATNVAELTANKPEHAINLAKQLRQRVQELTEKLEVFAPVYLTFTKADLIAGFVEFFEDGDQAERDRVWGATLPYDPHGKQDAVASFDKRFDELYEGLKEMAVARMSLHRGQSLPPGVLSFPLEFASLKPALRSFVATLFEENPFQFRPVFRGFYFTSALQEGSSTSHASERVARRFGLELNPATPAEISSQHGFFLRDLFSKVIFADRNLVKQYASRNKLRLRYAVFAVGVLALGIALGAWTWSYTGNRRLLANVEADLAKVAKLQEGRIDLQSRLDALEILQDRIQQLHAYREDRPLGISLGLYQGDAIAAKLQREYFNGLREILLKPVSAGIESYLAEVNANADALQPMTRPPTSGAVTAPVAGTATNRTGSQYSAASTQSVEDAYNALKTYLMLAERERMEAGHLSDQLTRFWRGWLETNRGAMPRERMIGSAERIISFALSQTSEPNFPTVANNLSVVDLTRAKLREKMTGEPAINRVYATIKARAATRFAPMTVARIVGEQDKEIVAGSYAIAGSFTREAWEKYVDDAIKEAANKELQSADWVLKMAARNDLTVQGSPEQIQKDLVQLYKNEYVTEWRKFMQGIKVMEFGSFPQAVTHMNRLGDPATSPVKKLMDTLYDQTSWDNPSLLNARLEQTQRGFVEWFKRTILRQAPSGVNVNLNVTTQKTEVPMGPIGREFAGLTRLMMSRDSTPTLLQNYLQSLSKIRTRFNEMKNQGDPGPASRRLMAQTLDGSSSELSDALRLVDEQMLTGMADSARATLRPVLVRPLMQSYAVIVGPAESEINRVWAAQVYEPFAKTLAGKYPFASDARIEASNAEIAQVFGPDGAIAKFSQQTLGPLVERRGDLLTPRAWADMRLQLRPEFSAHFAQWVAPLGGGGTQAAAAANEAQFVFQIQPLPTPGLTEFTLDIDGQVLRYRNGAADWSTFEWPGKGTPGARITGVTFDGRTVEVANHPGAAGLERLISSAKKKVGAVNHLSWSNGAVEVAVNLRVIRRPGATQGNEATPTANGFKGMLLPAVIAGESSPAAASTASSTVSADSSHKGLVQ